MRRVSEGGWSLNQTFSDVTLPTAISAPSSSLIQVTSGQSSGTSSQDASRLAPAAGAVGPSASPSPLKTHHGQALVEVKVSVQSASSLVYLLWSVVFAVQGELVWVFECCCLLFFKGLLALPWGYCSRNSYLCFSPACRLLTGTKWKTPAHSVLSVNMFPAHGFQLLVPRCSFSCFIYLFLICSASLGKPSGCKYCNMFNFFSMSCQCVCVEYKNHYGSGEGTKFDKTVLAISEY